jgi:hypothetical protein
VLWQQPHDQNVMFQVMDSDTSFNDKIGKEEVDLRTPNLCDTPNYLVNIINNGKHGGMV